MTDRRIRLGVSVFLGLASAVLAWWVARAGPATVCRTIVHNVSGIDDHRIFPLRRLEASPTPFRFRERANPQMIRFRVTAGRHAGAPLAELLEATETTAFLVVKGDAIVYEGYFRGYDRATPSLSFSMAKSFLSLLVGCALEDGYLRSVDQPVTDFVPELAGKGFDSVTLRRLLQMRSGLDYAENDFPLGIHARFYYTDRLEEEILKLRLAEPPGGRFVYRSGDAYLLSLALRRALGRRTITEYTQERIWSTLGMEHDGSWSIDHAPDGMEKTGCCLAATARDFAKIGRLYLRKGEWEGRRVVPETWIADSVGVDNSADSAWEYGYMWWHVRRDRPDFAAVGHLGQYLYVCPDAGTVIVRLGRSRGGLSHKEWEEVFLSLSDSLRRGAGNGASNALPVASQ